MYFVERKVKSVNQNRSFDFKKRSLQDLADRWSNYNYEINFSEF